MRKDKNFVSFFFLIISFGSILFWGNFLYSLCQSFQYNQTIYPNLLGHTIQDESALEIQQFIPLINIGCSSELKLFLCLLYVPPCSTNLPLPPCRSICESAKKCEKVMKTFNLNWPEKLKCENFPTDEGKNCLNYSN